MSKAFARKVQTKGSVMMHTPPITVYRNKNKTTDKIKRIQYSPVDFFVCSIFIIFNEIRANELISKEVIFSL
jgi:intracellular sulfur oxidation DsrE/DsrF family protein